MTSNAARSTLWPRVQALMVARWGAENQNKLAREAKVGVATIARMKTADTSIGADVLEKVAAALGVQAWQLLCPPEALAPDAPGPPALDLARQLDQIEEPELHRRAYAVAPQVIPFGVAPVATTSTTPSSSLMVARNTPKTRSNCTSFPSSRSYWFVLDTD